MGICRRRQFSSPITPRIERKRVTGSRKLRKMNATALSMGN
jgi:hypothetical protein